MKIEEILNRSISNKLKFTYTNHIITIGHNGKYEKKKSIEATLYIENKKIGYIEVIPSLKRLAMIYINPKYQNKGYATLLMN